MGYADVDGDWRLPLGLFALMMGLLSEKCFVEATRNVRTAGASSLFLLRFKAYFFIGITMLGRFYRISLAANFKDQSSTALCGKCCMRV